MGSYKNLCSYQSNHDVAFYIKSIAFQIELLMCMVLYVLYVSFTVLQEAIKNATRVFSFLIWILYLEFEWRNVTFDYSARKLYRIPYNKKCLTFSEFIKVITKSRGRLKDAELIAACIFIKVLDT